MLYLQYVNVTQYVILTYPFLLCKQVELDSGNLMNQYPIVVVVQLHCVREYLHVVGVVKV